MVCVLEEIKPARVGRRGQATLGQMGLQISPAPEF